jgi:serine/threonine protein phosphatase 1
MDRIDFYIGDVHGMFELLSPLVRFLERHASMRGSAARFVFIGDIVDRGPASKECLDLVRDMLERHEGSLLLLGNHEDMMLDAIDTDGKSEAAGNWALNGGMDTVASYAGDIRKVDQFLAMMKTTHADHRAMMRDARLFLLTEGLVAAHAGMDPTIDLEEQTRKALTWIREPFLNYVDPRIRPVVHGHSIVGSKPVVTENRISIDTGGYENGVLTAFIVDHAGWELSFASATGSGVGYVEPERLDRGYGTVLDDPRRVFDKSYSPEYKPREFKVT